jgi:hypothetical protein
VRVIFRIGSHYFRSKSSSNDFLLGHCFSRVAWLDRSIIKLDDENHSEITHVARSSILFDQGRLCNSWVRCTDGEWDLRHVSRFGVNLNAVT